LILTPYDLHQFCVKVKNVVHRLIRVNPGLSGTMNFMMLQCSKLLKDKWARMAVEINRRIHNMKTLIRTALISAAFALPVLAAEGAQSGGMMGGKGMMNGNGMMGGGMMNQEQMAGMHQRMQEMQTVMNKIREETDPAKRKQLMQEHMQMMQGAMQTMNSHMGNQNLSEGKPMDTGNMQKCIDMMQQRMNMMQSMMGQMVEHNAEEQKMEMH